MRSSGTSTPPSSRRWRRARPVHVGGHQEEGIRRQLRQAGRQWRPARQAPARAGPRLSDAGRPARLPVRHLRPGAQRRLRERGDRSRHRGVRGGLHPRLVAGGRPAAVSAGAARSSSRRTPAAATARACGCGSGSCSSSPTRRAGRCRSVISRPGTSKWNKVEHRLFSFISSNWRGEPLRDYETIVHLIARTTTAKGPEGHLSPRPPQVRDRPRRISDAEMETAEPRTDRFHGDWNYVIRPHRLRVRRPT